MILAVTRDTDGFASNIENIITDVPLIFSTRKSQVRKFAPLVDAVLVSQASESLLHYYEVGLDDVKELYVVIPADPSDQNPVRLASNVRDFMVRDVFILSVAEDVERMKQRFALSTIDEDEGTIVPND